MRIRPGRPSSATLQPPLRCQRFPWRPSDELLVPLFEHEKTVQRPPVVARSANVLVEQCLDVGAVEVRATHRAPRGDLVAQHACERSAQPLAYRRLKSDLRPPYDLFRYPGADRLAVEILVAAQSV